MAFAMGACRHYWLGHLLSLHVLRQLFWRDDLELAIRDSHLGLVIRIILCVALKFILGVYRKTCRHAQLAALRSATDEIVVDGALWDRFHAQGVLKVVFIPLGHSFSCSQCTPQ